jgi:hypothetical protein
MGKPPIWLDANILINLDKWRSNPRFAVPKAAYEAELIRLRADGHELLLTPQAKREVLFGGKRPIRPQDTTRMWRMVNRFGIKFDTMHSQVPRQQVVDWFNVANRNGLSREEAWIVAEIRASAQVRNVQNPVLLTRDAGGTLNRIRAQNVLGVEFKAPVVKEPPPPPPPAPPKLQKPATPAKPAGVPPVQTPPSGGAMKSIESITSRLQRLRAVARGSLPLRIVGGIAANVIFGLIGAFLQARANRQQIESDLERIEKEVQAVLAKKDAIDLIGKAQLSANSDEKVYAAFGIEIHHGQPRGPYWINKRYDYPSVADISAWIAPDGVQILALSESQKRFRGGKLEEKRNGMLIVETYYEYIEVAVYSADEVNAFNDLSARYYSLKRRLMMEPYKQELIDEMAKVKNAIVESFGSDVWFSL